MSNDTNSPDIPDPASLEIYQRMLGNAAAAMQLPGNPDWDTCLAHMAQLHEVAIEYTEAKPAIPIELIPLHAWEEFEGGKRFSAEGGWFYFFDESKEPKWVPESPARSMSGIIAEIPSMIPSLLTQMGVPLPPGMGGDGDAKVVAFPGGRSMDEPLERMEPRGDIPYELELDYIIENTSDSEDDFVPDEEGRVTFQVPRRAMMVTPMELPFDSAMVLGVRVVTDVRMVTNEDDVDDTHIIEDISFEGGFNLLAAPIDIGELESMATPPGILDVFIPLPEQPILSEPHLVKVQFSLRTVPVKFHASLIVQVLS